MSKTKTWIASIAFLALIGCFSCSQSTITEDTFLYPAEFEKHESIWLAWPTYQYEPGYSNEDVVLKIIESLAPYVPVDLMVRDETEKENVRNIFVTKNIDTDFQQKSRVNTARKRDEHLSVATNNVPQAV